MSLILSEKKNGILTITINRPEKKNALTREMYQSMADALFSIENDDSIKTVLFRGEGDCFTSGNDISDFAGRKEGDDVNESAAFMRGLINCKVPVVAQVHGMAVGIGTTMLLHCDFIYAETNTRFVLPFINLGLVPEFASSYLLPKMAGHVKASEWLMLGEPFGTEDACQFGLITGSYSAEELTEKVTSVCKKLVAKPSFALMQTKSLLKNDVESTHHYMDIEFDVFGQAMDSEAAREAFDAFLSKRPINPEKFK
ncbi:enoyl-CoA hydratase [Alteromonas sp. KS69]|jgi:enoyl-CoA hydratase/carnithine racemase|uniref:Enoyl-CoA hydratase n=1 Tax=Alteromonas naphthalenivorans TaxID=715451 RepID=F5Z8E1_ALTNA|nr:MULTISPECIES: enoyl-CoA hydratase [Alteromonas]AEF03334.1 enoyl-CoA hydratase [Alteromonas naphthalenivorans]MCQ8850601.1 enoyl-CoA hydratase [Alteromonas stellipolaris]RUP76454.1 enoyl-CoA hydratase [Alteromonas sp. KS69]|tara:strand:+ start:19540 stop:20304 length:765 start_codon:yes stop_codon:yes gene_type:complete